MVDAAVVTLALRPLFVVVFAVVFFEDILVLQSIQFFKSFEDFLFVLFDCAIC